MKLSKRSLVVVAFFSLAYTANAQQVEWLTDYKEASKIARENGKPILLDFSASWCKPCQAMEKTFWTRPDVIELSGQFVCVKVDFDKEKGLAGKYGVNAIPNVLTTDPWGNGLNYSRGFGGKPDDILKRLRFVPKDFSPIKQANIQLETDKNDHSALVEIVDFYNKNQLYYQSNQYGKRLYKIETDAPKRENLLLNMGFNYVRVGLSDEAEDAFKDFQKEFPQSPQNEMAMYGLIYANLQEKKTGTAEKLYAKFKTDYPASTYLAKLEEWLADAKQKKK
ncbi:MAG TPA: thioredoxin family protein [Pyrinomonadaceae bacterium]|nr:thioredoxin family protein [Pyrinomonadaceae bacterium]